MTRSIRLLAVLVPMLLGGLQAVGAEEAKPLVVVTERGQITLCPENGAILAVAEKGKKACGVRSGELGLWQVRFQDGSVVNAAEFSASSKERSFRGEAAGAGTLRLTYHSAELDVVVTVTGGNEGFDLAGQVTPRAKTVLDFVLPARLRFDPADLERMVFPADGNQSVGTAFLGSFFKEQAQPTSWKSHNAGPKAYRLLTGGDLISRDVQDPPVALRVTDEGRKWLGQGLSERINRSKATVNRISAPAQVDLVLVDSPNGSYLASGRLGGPGRLWRLGGMVSRDDQPLAVALVEAVVDRLIAQRPADRNKIGLLSLQCGPPAGSWATVPVEQWLQVLRRKTPEGAKVKLVELKNVDQLKAAQADGSFLAILNPYGELYPVEKPGDLETGVKAVGRYVRRGGNWFEVGGYSFHGELMPGNRYYEFGLRYPAAFADFFQLDTRSGTAAVYGVQPRDWAPWQGARDRKKIFIPGGLGCGGDENGGWCDRRYSTFVTAGQTWEAPKVRIALGGSAKENLRAYCQANGIKRRLEDKMSREVLAKFKTSVMLYYAGKCQEKLAHLELLPVPTQIHFADYLKGGFDKEYPDHLPPKADFGTPQEFRALFDKAHAMGHLVMPYTNPTWWCEGPKGPTFDEHGEAPLLKTLDGKVHHEQYSKNGGFTITFWHPAVQAANRKTVEQFLQEYPVDVLFQDQCGARGWHYDTNPASPTPYAYAEGMQSMVDEDSQRVPLSTESGCDRVVNGESQLCGMTWQIVPTEHSPAWRRLMKEIYDPATWEVFPLAQYIAHDKTAMIHHDLGQFVTNREVLSWSLGLGYAMSYRVGPWEIKQERHYQWLLWLDRLQKSVCARYIGEPAESFKHDRGPQPTREDDGMLKARYGSVGIIANVGPVAREEAGQQLAPFGFFIKAPGLVAANFKTLGGVNFGDEGISFVTETKNGKTDVWVYAPAEQEVAVLLPGDVAGSLKLVFDDGSQVQTVVKAGAHQFRLPKPQPQKAPANPETKFLWHAVTTGS
ncbi:MAG: DUF6259 domain-containing protein [Thermoguttaceae bacterium]